MSTIVGIDAGTTRFKTAVLDAQGNPKILTNDIGEYFMPSVVFFDKDRTLVGSEAIQAGFANPERCVRAWKRSMGTDTVLYSAPDGSKYRARDILKILLRKTAENVEQRTGEPLALAAVSTPANYNQQQVEETIQAAAEVGIQVICTPHEPTAAAYGNKVHRRGDGLYLILDLGGGTFDVTLLKAAGNTIEVLNTNGEPRLGGEDFDVCLTEILLRGWEEQHGSRPDPKKHRVFYHDLILRVEQVKTSLSSREETSVMLSCDGKVHSSTLKRAEFAQVCADLIEKAMERSALTLEEAAIGAGDLREIIPVGGASLMPMFQEAIERRFGRKPSTYAEPHYAVALGTAAIGRIVHEKEGGVVTAEGRKLPPAADNFVEVTSHAIGVCALDERKTLVNSVILAKGRPIPADYTRFFALAEPGQTSAQVKILQGPDGSLPEDCTVLGEFILSDLEPVFDRPHRIDVRMKFDKNGRVTTDVLDPMSGKSAQKVIDLDKSGAVRP